MTVNSIKRIFMRASENRMLSLILKTALIIGIYDLAELLLEILFVRLFVRPRRKNKSRGRCLRK